LTIFSLFAFTERITEFQDISGSRKNVYIWLSESYILDRMEILHHILAQNYISVSTRNVKSFWVIVSHLNPPPFFGS